MSGACRPTRRYILLDGEHRIEVVVEPVGGGQRYIPQVWLCDEDGGWWESLGESRQVLRDARNDCARHAERKEV